MGILFNEHDIWWTHSPFMHDLPWECSTTWALLDFRCAIEHKLGLTNEHALEGQRAEEREQLINLKLMDRRQPCCNSRWTYNAWRFMMSLDIKKMLLDCPKIPHNLSEREKCINIHLGMALDWHLYSVFSLKLVFTSSCLINSVPTLLDITSISSMQVIIYLNNFEIRKCNSSSKQ